MTPIIDRSRLRQVDVMEIGRCITLTVPPGQELQSLRVRVRMTLRHAARVTGLSPAELCELEQGRLTLDRAGDWEKLMNAVNGVPHDAR